uniref:Syntaxin-binding protein 5-like n=1 Tax=Phallusia mammillata TaxID=59560 RepID=A0A6F9DTC4_9ASCI|nr:syntaxin-binding protein 5-like [Phallusia mammillata]
MKKVTLKRVLDVLTPTSSPASAQKIALDATNGHNRHLDPSHFGKYKIARNGFPYKPTCLDYDPVQSLLAIGTFEGSIRILGKLGVEMHLTHELQVPVIQLVFLVNEGALLSVCADDSIHLWNLRQKQPAILHSLKFNKERLTHCYIPYQSKWIYVGTEKGNIYMCEVENFALSRYCLSWNKAIDLCQRSHPGYVVSIAENPVDESKMAVAYSTGLLVVWDIKNSVTERRYNADYGVTSISWHSDGKEFLSSHINGTICIWNLRQTTKPRQVLLPHGNPEVFDESKKMNKIDKAVWASNQEQNHLIVFSGGLKEVQEQPFVPSITIMQGKSVTVLEMDFPVMDFQCLCQTPWKSDFQQPFAVAILLEQEMVVVDLKTLGFPCLETPYGMDIHDSPVTCLKMYFDDGARMMPKLNEVALLRGSHSKAKMWPLNGGEDNNTDSKAESNVIVTGHVDGSIRFWEAKLGYMFSIYKLRTLKLFEKCLANHENCFAIENIDVHVEKQILIASNCASVMVYSLCMHHSDHIIECLNMCDMEQIGCENLIGKTKGNNTSQNEHQESDLEEMNGVFEELPQSFDSIEDIFPQRLKSSQPQQNPGFQAKLLCFFKHQKEQSANCQQIVFAIHASNDLLSIARSTCIFVVNYLTKVCLAKISLSDFGSVSEVKEPTSPMQTEISSSFSKEDQIFQISGASGSHVTNTSDLNTNFEGVTFATFSPPVSATVCLWIGTNAGWLSEYIIQSQKKTNSIHLNNGLRFQLYEAIVYCGFLTSTWIVLPRCADVQDFIAANSSVDVDQNTSTNSAEYIVACSKQQIKLLKLSTNTCMQSYSVEEMHGTEILVCYLETTSNGSFVSFITNQGILIILSLPTFSLLLVSSPLFQARLPSVQVCFEKFAKCAFVSSPSEIERIVLSTDIYESIQENTCQLFMPRNPPEREQVGILKSIFGKSYATLDRDELFGSEAGESASKGIATKYTSMNSNLQYTNVGTSEFVKDLQQLRKNVSERGQKLGDLEERTQQMQMSASKFSSNAHNVMLKFKNKKWYQL